MQKIMIVSLLWVALSVSAKEKSFEEIEKTNRSHRDEYFTTLPDLIIKSLDKKDCVSVKKYSAESFKVAEIVKGEWKSGGWNYGNAIFTANMALGMCSLQEKNLEQALVHLKKASESTGSPQLDTFGLRQAEMRLATELLKKGEKKPVINFLNECHKFWKGEEAAKHINAWIQTIEAGKIPDFQAFIP